jgi:membrane protein DedA with SNARE-associated domain
MIEWIESHGTWFYVITFFWTFLEGETFVIFAGFAAQLGILRLDYLIACAWIGSFCGDNLYFFLGRRYGERLVTRFPKMRAGTDLALTWLRRFDTWFILSFRFIYVVRNFSSFACGMSGIYWPRFMVLNFIAAGVWACTFAGAGYVFGAAFQHLIKDVALAFKVGVLCLFILVIGFSVFMHRKAKKQAARLQAQSAAPPPGA